MMEYFEAFKYYAYEESVTGDKKTFIVLSDKVEHDHIKYYLNNVKKSIGNVCLL